MISMTDNEVRGELVARLQVANRPPMSVLARFTYRRTDPWAVEFDFRTHKRWVEWVMARELLAAGIDSETGEGDVLIQPDPEHPGQTLMDLTSPDGEARFEFDTAELVELLALTTHLVPFGAEDSAVDWAGELQSLTPQE